MSPHRIVGGAFIAAIVALLGLAEEARAQQEQTFSRTASTRQTWQSRVLRQGQPVRSGARYVSRSGRLPSSPADPSTTMLTFEPEVAGEDIVDSQVILQGDGDQPLPAGETYLDTGQFDPYATDCGPACGGPIPCTGDCHGSGCGSCGEWGHPWLCSFWLFAGVQGFKGPADQGRNGNFGLHEGVNLGGPLLRRLDIGFQLGLTMVHSNFSGNQVLLGGGGAPTISGSDRDQFFMTTAIFRRAAHRWWQGGIAFDYFHDSYFATADLAQIRSETAVVLPGGREVGYWGAYGVTKDRFQNGITVGLQPTDQFAFFYRRHFSGGGQGRLSAGFTGGGDGLIAGNATIPIGSTWSIENHFTYLIPKQGTRSGGQGEESWSVVIRLVWYPRQSSRHVLHNPYHPLFYVADNSVFLVDRD